MILTILQKLPKNGEDWGKLIVAKGFKKLPKVQNIAQSGHSVCNEASCRMFGVGERKVATLERQDLQFPGLVGASANKKQRQPKT